MCGFFFFNCLKSFNVSNEISSQALSFTEQAKILANDACQHILTQMGKQKDKIYADKNIRAGAWVCIALLQSDKITANCPVQPERQEQKWSRNTSLGDSCLPRTSGAVNTVTLTPSSGYRVARFRILSHFLHSVSTVANVKSCRSNRHAKWHLDKSFEAQD